MRPLNAAKWLPRELPDSTPPNLQGLTGGTGGALQRVVLLDFGLEHRLRCDGGLDCLEDLLLQPYAKTSRMGLSTKGNKSYKGEGL